MPTLQVFPPNPENEKLMAEVRGFRQTPIPVVAFDGSERELGPEATGALLLLHMTMVDGDKTQLFWKQVALTCKAASAAPGFIRMIAFFDGCANWALGFWKTVEDAQAFARSRPHMSAIAEMHETNFEYTHYAGLWRPVEPRTRQAYCHSCGAEALLPVERCPECGTEFADVFRQGGNSSRKP